jgi:hypothetical protein
LTSPSLELQAAIVARLKAFSGLTSIISTRVYDSVSPTATFPYVSWGPEQVVSDDADCITGFEISIQLDAWSQAVGWGEAKRVAEQVRLALHDYQLSLTDNALVLLEHTQTAMLRDPDGKTSHAAIEFTALIEQP